MRISSGYLLATADQLAASALGFLFHILAAKSYDTATYGWLVISWATVSAAVLIWRALIGVPFVVSVNGHHTLSGRNADQHAMWRWTAWTVGILLFASVLLSVYSVASAKQVALALLILASGLMAGAFVFREAWRHVLVGDHEASTLGRLGVVSNGLAAISFAVGAAVCGFDPSLSVVMLAAACVVGVLATRPRERHVLADPVEGTLARWWSFGRHVFIGVLAISGASQLVLWIVLLLNGDAGVAVFGAATALIGLPRPAINAVTTMLTPAVASARRLNNSTQYVHFGWLGAVVLLIVASLAFLGFVLGPQALSLFFPEIPAGSSMLVGLLSASVGFEAGNGAIRGWLRGSGVPEAEASASMYASMACVIAAVLLVGRLGLEGAAASLLVLQAVFFSVGLSRYARQVQRGVRD